MYIQKNEKIEKISWISVFFPEMGRAAQITAQLVYHLIPPGLLTGPPQSPVAPSSHTLSLTVRSTFVRREQPSSSS